MKRELSSPRGIGALVGVFGLVAGGVALARRMMPRTKPWYERLGHTVTHDLHVPSGRQLRRLARR